MTWRLPSAAVSPLDGRPDFSCLVSGVLQWYPSMYLCVLLMPCYPIHVITQPTQSVMVCRGRAWDELGTGGGQGECCEDDAHIGGHLHGGVAAGVWQGPPHLLARVCLRSYPLGALLTSAVLCCQVLVVGQRLNTFPRFKLKHV